MKKSDINQNPPISTRQLTLVHILTAALNRDFCAPPHISRDGDSLIALMIFPGVVHEIDWPHMPHNCVIQSMFYQAAAAGRAVHVRMCVQIELRRNK